MHSKKVSFSSFFTALSLLKPRDLANLFMHRINGKEPDISHFIDFFENKNHVLENFNTYVLISNVVTAQMLYVTPSVLRVTGYEQDDFLKGGTSMFIKNSCPADTYQGMKVISMISDHQKGTRQSKSLFQYQTSFRYLHKKGYYKWMYNRMFFSTHDEKNYPLTLISFVTGMENFKANDNINYVRLKYDSEHFKYQTELQFEYQPDYINILKEKDLEILKLLAQGFDNKQIAERLNYSEHTVKDYRKKMLKKTWCDNSAELLTFALRNGLLKY